MDQKEYLVRFFPHILASGIKIAFVVFQMSSKGAGKSSELKGTIVSCDILAESIEILLDETSDYGGLRNIFSIHEGEQGTFISLCFKDLVSLQIEKKSQKEKEELFAEIEGKVNEEDNKAELKEVKPPKVFENDSLVFVARLIEKVLGKECDVLNRENSERTG